MADDQGVVVLVGNMPPDVLDVLVRLRVPFIGVVDPANGQNLEVPGAQDVITAAFRDDPTALLSIPLPRHVRAVLSYTEFGLLPASVLGETLGVPAIPVAVVARTRNKLIMRRLLDGVVDQPEFGVVGVDVPIRFPVVVKPVDGSGSRGVELVGDRALFDLRVEQVPGYLWESQVLGREYSVETFSHAGRHNVLGITEKITTGAPRFIETGHVAPATVEPELAARISTTVTSVLDALGMDNLSAHTEVMVEGNQVVLIETHTRPGGDRIPLLTKLLTGHDQYELAIRVLLGMDLPEPEPTDRVAVAAVRYPLWEDVVIAHNATTRECAGADGVVDAEVTAAPGSHVPRWALSRQRPAHIVVTANNRDDLRARLDHAEKLLAVHLDTNPQAPSPVNI